MATSFSLQSGIVWVNGSIASSTALNNAVNAATFSSTTASIIIGFNASSQAQDIPYSFQISNGLNFNTGTSWHTTTRGITIGDNASSCMGLFGQSTANALTVTWNYNVTASSASATISTLSNANPINLQGSVLNLQGAAGNNVTNGITMDRQIGTISTCGYSSTVTLDFNAATTDQTVTVNGNLTLATANATAGKQMSLRIVGSSASSTLTVPAGWTFIGASAPTVISANKISALSLKCYGTGDANVLAAYAAQP